MSDKLVTAVEILDEIQKQEHGFAVCQDMNLTGQLSDKISQMNWDTIKKENFIRPCKNENLTDLSWSTILINEMEENKNVSSKLVPNTRFIRLKKFILRIINVSTFWQERFNNAVVSFLQQSVSEMSRLGQRISDDKAEIYNYVNQTICHENEIINKQAKDIEVKYNQKLINFQESTKKILEIRLDEFQKELQTTYKTSFEEIQEKSVQHYQAQVLDIKKQLEELSNQNSQQNEKVIHLSDTLEQLQSLVSDIAIKHETTAESLQNTERWLSNVASRVNNNEDWLRIESQRINSHDTGYREMREELFWELDHSLRRKETHSSIKVKDSFWEKKENLNEIRLNIGCGPQDIAGYINVDMRDLPNVDIISDAMNLPFSEKEVDVIFSSHLLEHFTRIQAEKELLPYWHRLLKDTGELILLLPNIGVMAQKYATGEIPFERLALLISGGQEYKGNYHLAVYDPDTVTKLLHKCGFINVLVTEEARPNGDCWEMEIHAKKRL